MQEGDILTIKSGYYSFEDGLSDVDKVTVRGEGMIAPYLILKIKIWSARPFGYI